MKKVSVFVIAYKQENLIGQAIESIVAQKTTFDFEVVIGEDCSPDGTRAICEGYAAKYPGLIRLLPSDRNYGAMGNTIRTLEACTGEYIALCEGDDYWTDSSKLQQQVDFLDAHPDFSLCFTGVSVKDDLGWELPDEQIIPTPPSDILTIEDFILAEMNFVPTPSLVFRNVLPKPFPEFFVKGIAGDIGIQIFAAAKGKAKYLPQKMAVYRNHAGGVSKSEENKAKGDEELMKLLKALDGYYGYRYHATFRIRFLSNAKTRLIYGAKDKKGMQRLRHYFKTFPDYIKYSDKLNISEIAYYHAVLFLPFILKPFKKKG